MCAVKTGMDENRFELLVSGKDLLPSFIRISPFGVGKIPQAIQFVLWDESKKGKAYFVIPSLFPCYFLCFKPQIHRWGSCCVTFNF
jgi:hypothetical protein